MTARILQLQQPHFTVRPCGNRWCVAHAAPGRQGEWNIDVDCPTMAAAEYEARWMNAERDRDLQRERQEAALLGLRPTPPHGVWA